MSSNVPTINPLDLPSLPLDEHHDLLGVPAMPAMPVDERIHA
jgi:hypothetical protein